MFSSKEGEYYRSDDADPAGCEPCGRLPGSVTMLEAEAEAERVP